jgi:hypothetical protein
MREKLKNKIAGYKTLLKNIDINFSHTDDFGKKAMKKFYLNKINALEIKLENLI